MIKRLLLIMMLSFVLLLSACTLAKSEVEAETEFEDRFVGVYVVKDELAEGIYDLEGWIEDGMEQHKMDSVHFDVPRMIFPAEYVQEEHRYRFPGLQGYALFAAKVGTGADAYSITCSDLENVNVRFHTRDEDLSIVQTGDENAEFVGTVTDYELTGTIYLENISSEGYIRLLKVFQKPDGTIYLDGTGDGFSGGGALSLEENVTKTVNGEEAELGTTKVTVTVEEAKEADRGILYWYGEKGELLATQPIEPRQVSELAWQDKAAWVIYEEVFGDEVVHTLYEKGTEEAPAVLTIMTINEDGIGEVKTVEIK